MARVNIPSTVDDPNYRYKMPSIRCKVEGSGNGIRTNHMNMRDVATALKRNPEYVTKFLACELCVHGRYFDNEGKAIFTGAHQADDIASKLDAFINSYVLCPACHLPEIDLLVENKFVVGKCNACGISSQVNNIHRVAAFIVKNPPEGSTVCGKLTKEEKRAKKEAANAKEKDGSKAVDKGTGEGGRKKKVVKKKVVKKVSKKKGGATDDGFDLKSETANMIMVRMNIRTSLPNANPADFYHELRAVQLTQALSQNDVVYLALGALFDCGVKLEEDEVFGGEYSRVSVAEFKDMLPYLTKLAYDCSKEAITALQLFMYNCVTEVSYRAHYPLLLKAFYDENIVDEDDVIDYYKQDHESEDFKKAKEALQPFLKWLEEVEANDDSYDSDSEEKPENETV